MSLEEEILSIEQEAAAIVASARAEAKSLLGTIEGRKAHVAKEISQRIEKEKKRLEEKSAVRLRESLAGVERDMRIGVEAVEKAGREKAAGCVRAILENLLGR
jgi:actin-like ATPase involved in cell morphogenesis